MIEKTTGFKVGEQVFASLTAAQTHGLREMLGTITEANTGNCDADAVARLLVNKADEVVDLLTTNPKSRAKARKINGAKRTRKPTAPAVPEGNGAGVIGKGVAP